MERSSRSHSLITAAMILLMTAVLLTAARPTNGKSCGDCIRDKMALNCPACASPLRCMVQCLWGGGLRSKCTNRCDSGSAWPRLSTCKRCMSSCKCSCTPSSSV